MLGQNTLTQTSNNEIHPMIHQGSLIKWRGYLTGVGYKGREGWQEVRPVVLNANCSPQFTSSKVLRIKDHTYFTFALYLNTMVPLKKLHIKLHNGKLFL